MKSIFTLILSMITFGLMAQTITTPNATYEAGSPLTFDYTGAPGNTTDWIGVYAKGEVPDGDPASFTWAYITTPAGQLILDGQNQAAPLVAGEYSAHLFCCDGYTILASCNFTITGDVPASIDITAFTFKNKNASFAYSGGTGSPTDWIGIYTKGVVPGTDPSLAFVYVPSEEGTMEVDLDSLPVGTYDAHLLCCDGYEILASTEFTVYDSLAPGLKIKGNSFQNLPLTFEFSGGTGSFLDWIGIYPADTIPDGDPGSIYYEYVNAPNGEQTLDTIPGLVPGAKYDAHLFCCDGYNIIASVKGFSVTVSSVVDLADRKLFSILPIQQGLDIRFEDAITGKIHIYNMMGQIVRSVAVQNETQLHIYNLNLGNYIVQFTDGTDTQAQKAFVR